MYTAKFNLFFLFKKNPLADFSVHSIITDINLKKSYTLTPMLLDLCHTSHQWIHYSFPLLISLFQIFVFFSTPTHLGNLISGTVNYRMNFRISVFQPQWSTLLAWNWKPCCLHSIILFEKSNMSLSFYF